MASDSPRPTSIDRTRRRSCWRTDSDPVVAARGSVRPSGAVAVVAGDLLDHVDLGGRVVAPRRDLDVDVVARGGGGEADRIEQLLDPRRTDVGAEEPGDPRRCAPARVGRSGSVAGGDGGCRPRGRTPRRSANRRMARSTTSGSVPFSKRADASDRSLCRRDDFTIPIGWNQAISRSTSVVASSISLEAPPMIPARPTGTSSPPQISRSSAVSRPLDVVEGGERLALAGDAHPEPGTGHLGQVVRVVGLAQLEHHVVGHVDHVADRAHAHAARAGWPASDRRGPRSRRAAPGPRTCRTGRGRGSRRRRRRRGRPPPRWRAGSGRVNGSRSRAARSRATPAIDMASGRFGLISRS